MDMGPAPAPAVLSLWGSDSGATKLQAAGLWPSRVAARHNSQAATERP